MLHCNAPILHCIALTCRQPCPQYMSTCFAFCTSTVHPVHTHAKCDLNMIPTLVRQADSPAKIRLDLP